MLPNACLRRKKPESLTAMALKNKRATSRTMNKDKKEML
jgi:hypothetical protein